jgi:rhamnogalacturonan lyase-like protein
MLRINAKLVLGIILTIGIISGVKASEAISLKDIRKQVIKLAIPGPEDSAGGVIAANVNEDGALDFLVTVPGHLAVYGNEGKKLWVLQTDIVVGCQSESQGLPGHNGPGVAATDVDGDGHCEVIFLTKDSTVHFVDGRTGREKYQAKPPVPKGVNRWELAMPCDLRGTGGERDILLQATNAKGYRTGKYLTAYSIKQMLARGKPLWQTDQFLSCAHNGARIADLNGDGKDEILGATLFSANGKLITKAVGSGWHMDSVFVADVRPEIAGLEVVLLEEGANQVQLLGMAGPIWRNHYKKQEPQNATLGRFKAGSEEIFLWCRSRYSEHQKPFVFDSKGKLVFEYKMDDVAPKGWTASGVEIIYCIDWTGKQQQLACAKERHTSGDVCIFEPLTGKFVLRIPEKADRLYVADVSGDWREEIVVLNGSELHIYENKAVNPRPKHKRLWTDRNYRRMKQYYNYYSP